MVTVYILFYIAFGSPIDSYGLGDQRTLFIFDTKEQCEAVRVKSKSKDLCCVGENVLPQYKRKPYFTKNWF